MSALDDVEKLKESWMRIITEVDLTSNSSHALLNRLIGLVMDYYLLDRCCGTEINQMPYLLILMAARTKVEDEILYRMGEMK